MNWINEAIETLDNRDMPNQVAGIQDLLNALKKFRADDKPPHAKEKNDLEAKYLHIQVKRKYFSILV